MDPFYATPKKVLTPWVLDQIDYIIDFIREFVPSAPLWIGETGSSVGAGQAGVSDAFVDGFWFLDELSKAARTGHTQVNRQTLCGYHYGILYQTDPVTHHLQVRPSYFALVLWKRMIGSNVLASGAVDESGKVRAYAYSGRGEDVCRELSLVVPCPKNVVAWGYSEKGD